MLRRFVAVLLMISLALPAHAGMIATTSTLDHARIAELLDRAEVQAQLKAHGVSPAEAKARVAALTEVEAAAIAARIDTLPAGGVNIISALLIVFLVLLLTDILGFTKVFPFTRPVR